MGRGGGRPRRTRVGEPAPWLPGAYGAGINLIPGFQAKSMSIPQTPTGTRSGEPFLTLSVGLTWERCMSLFPMHLRRGSMHPSPIWRENSSRSSHYKCIYTMIIAPSAHTYLVCRSNVRARATRVACWRSANLASENQARELRMGSRDDHCHDWAHTQKVGVSAVGLSLWLPKMEATSAYGDQGAVLEQVHASACSCQGRSPASSRLRLSRSASILASQTKNSPKNSQNAVGPTTTLGLWLRKTAAAGWLRRSISRLCQCGWPQLAPRWKSPRVASSSGRT